MRRTWRVLVTRPREQAAELCDLLAAGGFEPVCLPAIQPQPVEQTAALDAAIGHLRTYDWIVFASQNAAQFFLQRVAALGKTVSGARIVCGPATAYTLAQYGLAPALTPAPFSAEAALEAMRPHLRAGSRVLLPRAEGGRKLLATGLRAAGAYADEVVVYRTVAAGQGSAAIAGQLETGEIDAITFFSPSAVRGFAAAMETAGIAAPRLRNVLESMAIACIGPTTATAVEEAGWHVEVVAPDTTSAALVDALAAWFTTTGAIRRNSQ